jgi:hypothetical protein
MSYEVAPSVYPCGFSLSSSGAIGLVLVCLPLVDFPVDRLICGGFLAALLDEATSGTDVALHVPLINLP